MTTPTHSGDDTLLALRTDEAPAAAPPAAPTAPRLGWIWPTLAVTVAAIAALGVWTLSQLRDVDAPVDTPAITDHDPWIQERLRERNRAFDTQLDPWAEVRLRERNQAFEAHPDPWVERLRAQQATAP
jgi:hypothetical protein